MDETTIRATMLQAVLANGIPMAQAIEDAEAAVRYVLGGAQASRPVGRRATTERVLDMWSSGKTNRAIAAELGVSVGAVAQRIKRARLAGDPRAALRNKVSDEGLAAMRRCARRMMAVRLSRTAPEAAP